MPKTPRNVGGPTITLTHDTDRTYARAANSTILAPWAREILSMAANGEEVHAWILDRALVQALSACTTRDGQSMVRRDRARKVRHLLYKTEAVIENWAAGLPPYEGGPRSPRIHELEDQVAKLQDALHDEEMKRREAEEGWSRLAANSDMTFQRLNYALSLVDETIRARVEGYTDGLREGRA